MQRIKINILTAALFLFSCIYGNAKVYAQTDILPAAKRNYLNGTNILAKKELKTDQLDHAIDELNKSYQADSNYIFTPYYLGYAYFLKKDYARADRYFNMYARRSGEFLSDYYLFAGINKYQLTENIAAQELLQFYMNSYTGDKVKDSLAQRYTQLAKQSQTLMSKTLPSKKEPLAGINTELYDEYYPILTPDRKNIIFNRLEKDSATQKPMNRIYIYNIETGPAENNPRLLPINNINNREFIITSMSSAGTKILLISKDNKGLYDIYESEWMIREFGPPNLMYSQVNSFADDKFATYAHNDSLIYVISNRPGGYGGYDIWKINYNYRYIHESMINLGPAINTAYDENYIGWVANSNVLFFSSEGHINIGETDIFRTKLVYGQYTRPVNLGYPINTISEDRIFFPYTTANMGLSEVQNSTRDIYITYLPPKAKKPAYIREEQYLVDSRLGKTTVIIPGDE